MDFPTQRKIVDPIPINDGQNTIARQPNIENIHHGDFTFYPVIYLPSRYRWDKDKHMHIEIRRAGWYKLDEDGYFDETVTIPDHYS